jgi:hypothetical protein
VECKDGGARIFVFVMILLLLIKIADNKAPAPKTRRYPAYRPPRPLNRFELDLRRTRS